MQAPKSAYTINGLSIKIVSPELCVRLAQFGNGQIITCRCSVCAKKNQTSAEAYAAVYNANFKQS